MTGVAPRRVLDHLGAIRDGTNPVGQPSTAQMTRAKHFPE